MSTRWMQTVIGILGVSITITVGWAAPASQPSTGVGSDTPKLAGWIDPLDRRGDDAKRYQALLQAQVAHVVALATVDTPSSVIDAEKEISIDAMPLLHEAMQRADLPPAAAKALADAWAADSDRVQRSEIRQKALLWYRKTTLDVFDANVPPNAHWALPARTTLVAAVGIWSGDHEPIGDGDMIMWREGRSAVQAHCTDPLALYARAQNLALFTPGDRKRILAITRRAEQSMEKSNYPPICKLYAAFRLAERIAESKSSAPQDAAEIERLVALTRTLFPKVIADPDLPRVELMALFEAIGEASAAIYKDRQTLPAQLFDMLAGSKASRSEVLTIQGSLDIADAWDARGNGWASTVTDEGAKLMAERLDKAQGALEEAWRLDHTNSDAAAYMIGVELGQGQGRDRMEMWFDRAVTTDSTNSIAYHAKLNYLEPKWYGSVENMVDFGRQCLAKGSWDGAIPMILVEAHMEAAHYSANGWQDKIDPSYFQGNDAAWEDIKTVYTAFFRRAARNDCQNFQYAKLAGLCGHWDEAHRMFLETGKAFDSRVFDTAAERDKFAAEAAGRATTAPTSNP